MEVCLVKVLRCIYSLYANQTEPGLEGCKVGTKWVRFHFVSYMLPFFDMWTGLCYTEIYHV